MIQNNVVEKWNKDIQKQINEKTQTWHHAQYHDRPAETFSGSLIALKSIPNTIFLTYPGMNSNIIITLVTDQME